MPVRRTAARRARRLPRTFLSLVVLLLAVSAYEYLDAGTVSWPRDATLAVREFFTGLQAPSVRDPPPADSNGIPAHDLAGRVVAVADGDTFTLRLAGQRDFRLRLHGIDAPERNQPHGSDAHQALANMVLGKDVYVVLQDADNFGRLVVIAFVGDQEVNLALVRDGLAWWYPQFAPERTDLEQAEATARRARAGLWSDPKATAPWDWRRR